MSYIYKSCLNLIVISVLNIIMIEIGTITIMETVYLNLKRPRFEETDKRWCDVSPGRQDNVKVSITIDLA